MKEVDGVPAAQQKVVEVEAQQQVGEEQQQVGEEQAGQLKDGEAELQAGQGEQVTRSDGVAEDGQVRAVRYVEAAHVELPEAEGAAQ